MEQFYVSSGRLSPVLKEQILSCIMMLVVLIVNIYSIVTSLQELVMLTKSASEYCIVAMKNLVLSSSLQNFSQIILYDCYPQSRKERKVIQVTPFQLQKKIA